MFRATTDQTPDGPTLKFEGRLTGAWVDEAEIAWRDVNAGRSRSAMFVDLRRIFVDLRDVSLVDDRGRALLQRMHSAGARFLVRGCVMRELVREITEAGQEITDAEPGIVKGDAQSTDFPEETRA